MMEFRVRPALVLIGPDQMVSQALHRSQAPCSPSLETVLESLAFLPEYAFPF